MLEGELITVAQFAEREGISRQAVYKRLNKGLNQYCKQVDGIRLIDYSAYLRDRGEADDLPADNPEVDRLTAENNRLNRDVDSLTAEVERLRAELSAERAAHREDTAAAMDLITSESERHAQQTAALSALLDAERAERVAAEERAAQQIAALTDALSRAQALQHEAQQLHALTAAGTPSEPEPEDAPPLDDQTDDPDGPGDPEDTEDTKPPKRSIWSILFRR